MKMLRKYNSKRLWVLGTQFLLLITLFVATSGGTNAAPTVYRKFSQSPVKIATFLNCEQGVIGVCLPMLYRWQGSVSIDYEKTYDATIRAYRIKIKKYDQSVTMFGVGSNPCNISMGITSDGRDKWGNYYWTIRPTHRGDYIYASTSILYGGVAYPNWSIPEPKLTVKAVSAAQDCMGYSSLSWDVTLP